MFIDNFKRYFIESLVISLVSLYIPRINLNVKEILMISLTGAFTLMIIDLYAPQVGLFLRHSLGGILGFKNIGSSQLATGGGVYKDFSKGVKFIVQNYKEIEAEIAEKKKKKKNQVFLIKLNQNIMNLMNI